MKKRLQLNYITACDVIYAAESVTASVGADVCVCFFSACATRHTGMHTAEAESASSVTGLECGCKCSRKMCTMEKGNNNI